jgi:hypothetical protein
MPIITLTTDMGTRDHYIAAVKGYLMSNLKDVQVVDISHQIRTFDIQEAAFVIAEVYRDFPEESIHLIGVDSEADESSVHLIVRYNHHWFIGTDNGIFSFLFDELPSEIFEINVDKSANKSFPLKNVFAKAAVHLANAGNPLEIANPMNTIKKLELFPLSADNQLVECRIRYIDTYGNLITNLNKETFYNWLSGRTFEILYRDLGGQGIRKIHERYGDVKEGERVALFNSSGWLEIALNRGTQGSGGGANKLFGAKVNDVIRIKADDY